MTGVSVTIGANTDQFESAVNRSKGQLREFGREAREGVTTIAKVGAAATAAGVAIGAGLVAKGLSAVDAQAKLAKQLNSTSSSMATIARAGDLSGISIEKINASATRLTRRLSLAEAGAGPAADAIQRLGFNAAEVAQLPLDERIAKVNSAINIMIPAAEQAGVATQLFGEEAGIAMRTLDSEVLAQAAREAKVLGTSISEFDAAQIERANDAMSTIGTAVEGVSKQLAIQLAPIIEGIGNLFFETAEEAGGIGEATSDAFGFVVEASAQVINAVDGIKRVFEVVADGIIFVWNEMASKITSVFQSVLESISNDVVPGMDFSETIRSLENFSTQAGQIADFAGQNISDTLQSRMAGDQFKEFVAEQKEIARKAKEEFKEEGLQVPDIIYGTPEENEERTEQEMDRQDARNELMLKRQQNHEEMATKIRQNAEEQRRQQAEQQARLRESVEGDMWNSLTSLMNSGSRKMFEIGKVAAITESVMSTYKGASKALELGWPLGPIAATAITSAGFANVAKIKSQSFNGGGGGGGSTPTANINESQVGTATQNIQRSVSFDFALTGASDRESQFARSLAAQLNEEIEGGARINRIGIA